MSTAGDDEIGSNSSSTLEPHPGDIRFGPHFVHIKAIKHLPESLEGLDRRCRSRRTQQIGELENRLSIGLAWAETEVGILGTVSVLTLFKPALYRSAFIYCSQISSQLSTFQRSPYMMP